MSALGALLALVGCDGAPSGGADSIQDTAGPPTSCEELDCGDHGACSEHESGPRCGCDPLWTGARCDRCAAGYHFDGAGGCVVNLTCEPGACHGHGACDDVFGTLLCACSPGYAGDTCDRCDEGYRETPDGGCARRASCDEGAPCGDHGACDDAGGVITCSCEAGWSGARCEECATGWRDEGGVCLPNDRCLSDTCGGHGQCRISEGLARCTCDSGYLGAACEYCSPTSHRDDEGRCVPNQTCAQSNPCGPFGGCRDEAGEVYCDCAPGYAGYICRSCAPGHHMLASHLCTPDLSCRPSSCAGVGDCVETLDGVLCTCPEGYGGPHCARCLEAAGYHRSPEGACVPDSACAGDECGAHGACSDEGGQPRCECEAGWAPPDCEVCAPGYHDEGGACVIDLSCRDTTCAAGGACDDTSGVALCACDEARSGPSCTQCRAGYHRAPLSGDCVLDEVCDEGSCRERGACSLSGGRVRCDCVFDFAGDQCEGCARGYHPSDEQASSCLPDERCEPDSCRGRGECATSAGVIACACEDAFAGAHCELCAAGFHLDGEGCVPDEECLPAGASCGGHGDCALSGGLIACACDGGYQGPRCERCATGFHEPPDAPGTCEGDEPCLPESCGGHGSCRAEGGIVYCDCAEGWAGPRCDECAAGYHAEGAYCAPDEACDGGGSTCSGHGTCDASGGAVRCACETGYDDLRCDECAAGFHHEGATCAPDERCAGDGSSCGGHGACSITAGRVDCACAEGYGGPTCDVCAQGFHSDAGAEDATPPGLCVPDEECTALTCGGHGVCTLPEGLVACACAPDWQGPRCGDRRCPEGAHMEDGACVPDETCAASALACGDHGACEVVEGRARCACAPGWSGARCDDCAPGLVLQGGGCALADLCDATRCSGVGACAASASGLSCTCPSDYEGEDCERCAAGSHRDQESWRCRPDSTCTEERCGDHGACSEEQHEARCVCALGWGGELCDGCAPGFTLDGVTGRCERPCGGGQPGQIVCAGRCTDVTSDDAHCGACGAPCQAGAGAFCYEGACVTARPGDDCALPFTLPEVSPRVFIGLGDTGSAGLRDALSTEGCPIEGRFDAPGDQPEETWRWTAPSAGDYDVTVTPFSDGLDPIIYAWDDATCAPGSCLGQMDSGLAGQGETLRLTGLAAGATVTLAVDAYGDTGGGAYRLTVQDACASSCPQGGCEMDDGCGRLCSCGEGERCEGERCQALPAPPGDRCADALPLSAEGAGVFSAQGDTGAAGQRDTLDPLSLSCAVGAELTGEPGAFSPDAFWRFTAPSEGPWEALLEAPEGLFVYAILGSTCDGACLGLSPLGGQGGSPRRLDLGLIEAGQVVTLVIDGDHGAAGPYALTLRPTCTPSCPPEACHIDDGCGGVCGCGGVGICDDDAQTCVTPPGDGCAEARELPALSDTRWVGQGDTSGEGYTDALSTEGCPHAGGGSSEGPGRDQAWRLTVRVAGDYEVKVTRPEGSPLDALVSAYRGPECLPTTCVGYAGAGEGGERVVVTGLAAEGAELLTVVVDGWAPDSAGPYQIEVSRLPAERCAQDLFISEYLEGEGGAAAIELYNGTAGPVDLSGYALGRLPGGLGAWPGVSAPLSGLLDQGETYVICASDGPAALLARCDLLLPPGGAADFNGNDALALLTGELPLDIIGGGAIEGLGWPVAGVPNATWRHGLRRKAWVEAPSSTWEGASDDQWELWPPGDLSDLGSHEAALICGCEDPHKTGATCDTCAPSYRGPECGALRFVALALDETAVCGVLGGGALRCWGGGDQAPPALDHLRALEGGGDHFCARTRAGVSCWRRDPRLGESWPVLPAASSLSVGDAHACAIDEQGLVHCVGDAGQDISPPEGLVATSVAAGYGGATVAVRPDGQVAVWGGALGALSAPQGALFPGAQACAGRAFGCALHKGGALTCWGLGAAASEAPEGDGFTDLRCGEATACALELDGALRCWGDDTEGAASPPSGEAFVSLDLHGHTGCALTAEGEPRCWGDDNFARSEIPTSE